MVELDKITKQDLLALLESADSDSFDMDPYDETSLHNRAHRIIYKNLYDKFNDFRSDIDRFRVEAEKLYFEAVNFYEADVQGEVLIEEEFPSNDEMTNTPHAAF